MALNIKNPETHQLAHELAQLTGESLTVAVTEAVRERLERVRQAQSVSLVERALELAREAAPRWKEPLRSINHGDFLYDDQGLPR